MHRDETEIRRGLRGVLRREEEEGRATLPSFGMTNEEVQQYRNEHLSQRVMDSQDANARQPGGDHYRRSRGIQHWDFVHMVGLGYYNGNATKYVGRNRFKNGAQDLEKALHYCDKAIELDLDSPEEMRHISDFEMIVHQYAADNELLHCEYEATRLLALSRYIEAKHVIERMLKSASTVSMDRPFSGVPKDRT